MDPAHKSHKFSLSLNDWVEVSESGGRINKLVLGGVLII